MTTKLEKRGTVSWRPYRSLLSRKSQLRKPVGRWIFQWGWLPKLAPWLGIAVAMVASGITYWNGIHQLRVQQQPWVGIEGLPKVSMVQVPIFNQGTKQVVTEEQVRGTYTLKNFGPTPALNIGQSSQAQPSDHALGISQSLACETAESQSTGIWPQAVNSKDGIDAMQANQADSGMSMFPSGTYEAFFFMPARALTSPAGEFYLAGCIRYRDQFQAAHETRYCYLIGKSVVKPQDYEAMPCNRFNSANGVDSPSLDRSVGSTEKYLRRYGVKFFEATVKMYQ